jgi:hypothetical protein
MVERNQWEEIPREVIRLPGEVRCMNEISREKFKEQMPSEERPRKERRGEETQRERLRENREEILRERRTWGGL